MAKFSTGKALLKAICDAIKRRERTTAPIKFEDIPERIEALPTIDIFANAYDACAFEGKDKLPCNSVTIRFGRDVFDPSLFIFTMDGEMIGNNYYVTPGTCYVNDVPMGSITHSTGTKYTSKFAYIWKCYIGNNDKPIKKVEIKKVSSVSTYNYQVDLAIYL